MKKYIIFLIFIALQIGFAEFSYSQSGTIVFQNGTSVKFNDLIAAKHETLTGTQGFGKDLIVVYQNADQKVPWTKVKSLEILSWSYYGGGWAKVQVHVVTKTGIEVTYNLLFGDIYVSMYNSLTGDVNQQTFTCITSEQLNFKSILID